jgi:drug/metabolite transporter (DMT)-like permease
MTDSAVRPVVWMLCGAFLFATMSALTHALGTRCDWLVVALVRAAIMFGATGLTAWLSGVRLVLWDPPTLWMRSLAGSFSLVCNFFALTRLPVADALTLNNTYPLWIVLLAWWRLRQRPTVGDLLSVAAGTAGVVLVQQPHLSSGNNLAALVALVSSFATAVAMLGLHRLKHIDPRAVVTHFAGVASVVALTWFCVRGGARGMAWRPDALTLWMLLGVGATGTAGQVFLTKAYAAGPPSRVAVVGLSQIAFALGFDVLLWSRALSLATLLGFALVLTPTAWILSRSARGRTDA